MMDYPALDLRKPHHVHQEKDKITVYDQNEVLYDGVTMMPLDMENLDTLRNRYAVYHDGEEHRSVSKVKSMKEKVQDVLSTMRASGAVDPDMVSQFERLMMNTLEETPTPKPEEPRGVQTGKLIRTKKE